MARGHHVGFCFDVGALGEELLDEVKTALPRREVEGGKAVLRCGGGGRRWRKSGLCAGSSGGKRGSEGRRPPVKEWNRENETLSIQKVGVEGGEHL
jgi:hypothetical protein